MGDPILNNGELILLNPDDDFIDDVVDDWATLIEAKSGSSSFDIKDSTLEFHLFPENTIFTNKREMRRRIKTILDNCTFPDEQKRKATECYAENPEYMLLPIDKMDPRKIPLFDVIDESFICANDLESKGMLKTVENAELDWNTFSMFKGLNFISKEQKVLDKETEGNLVKRIPPRRPRPKPVVPVIQGTLKNRKEDDEYYPEREKDLASERKRRESEIERKRRELEQDFEQQQERLYELYKTSQRKREQDLAIQSQIKIKDTANSRGQNSKPQQSERHHQKSSYENHRKSSPDKKERERERKRDQSPESPRRRHHKSKKKHRDRSSSSERTIFSPSSTSSFEERSVPKHHFSSKTSREKAKIQSPPARRRDEEVPRAQFNSKKPKQIEEIITLFSDDSSEQSQGYSIPITNKKVILPLNSVKKNRRNSNHINPSSLESIPEEAHPDSDELEIFEITAEDHNEIARMIEEKINHNIRPPSTVKKCYSEGNLEIVKVQEEIIIPSRRPHDEEHEEIAQLMEENINKSRDIPKPAKIEEGLFSQYKEEMGQLIKEIIHKEFQQIGIGKHYDEEYEDLGKILEEKINKNKVLPKPPRVEEEEDFSTQYKKAMAQVNQNSLPTAEIIEEEEENPDKEDKRDLAQLLEEETRQSRKSHKSKKSDKNCDTHRPLLMHDVIEDHSQDIYDPELAQLIEEKVNQSQSSSSQLKKVAENENGHQEKQSAHSPENSLHQSHEVREEENPDQELTKLIEEKIHSSKNSSPQDQKANKNHHIDQEAPRAQEQHSYRHSSHNEERNPDRDGMKESKNSSPHKKVTENSRTHDEKQSISHHHSESDHHRSEATEDGEISKDKVRKNKNSSFQHQKISKDDHNYHEKQPTHSHHKRSPNRHHHDNRHYRDRSHKKLDYKNEHKGHQDGKVNFHLKVEYGKSNFPSETSIDQFGLLNNNCFSQENSEVLVIDDDNEDKEEFNSVELVISDHGKENNEVEEIDISEVQTQDLNKKITDLKLNSPKKKDSKIFTLGTVRLPQKENPHDKDNKNNIEPSNPSSVSNSPTQTLILPPGTQPIVPYASQFLNQMNQIGNCFGGPFRGPAPFQYSPLIFFPSLHGPFGSGGVFPGNFMPPPQMRPLQQSTTSRNNSEMSNENSGSADQE